MHTRRRHPFLDVPGPIGFAHRGGAGEAPENTIPAFEAAAGLGYRYVETDVHVTRDGVVLAFHDPRLDRVTDRTGAIAELGIDEVDAADAGFHFTPDSGSTFPFRGQGIRVPRLEDLLTALPEVRVNIDVKASGAVDPLIALLDKTGAWERICIGSFSDARLARIRRIAGDRACTSMGPRGVTGARLGSLVGWIARGGADCMQIPLRDRGVRLVDAAMLRAAHRAGLPVHVWTVDDAATMNRLLDMGVDGIMTDAPRRLRDVFARHGLGLDGSGRSERAAAVRE